VQQFTCWDSPAATTRPSATDLRAKLHGVSADVIPVELYDVRERTRNPERIVRCGQALVFERAQRPHTDHPRRASRRTDGDCRRRVQYRTVIHAPTSLSTRTPFRTATPGPRYCNVDGVRIGTTAGQFLGRLNCTGRRLSGVNPSCSIGVTVQKLCTYAETVIRRSILKALHNVGASDDRQVHFQSPGIVDRLDAIADLFGKKTGRTSSSMLSGNYIEDTADSETFPGWIATK